MGPAHLLPAGRRPLHRIPLAPSPRCRQAARRCATQCPRRSKRRSHSTCVDTYALYIYQMHRAALAEASAAVTAPVLTCPLCTFTKCTGQPAQRRHAHALSYALRLPRTSGVSYVPCTVTPQVSTEPSTARLTPMASTDQAMASPSFTPLQPAVPTPGPNDVDLRATVGVSPSTTADAVASASGSTTKTRDMD